MPQHLSLGVQVTQWPWGCLVLCGPWAWPYMVYDGDLTQAWGHTGPRVACVAGFMGPTCCARGGGQGWLGPATGLSLSSGMDRVGEVFPWLVCHSHL